MAGTKRRYTIYARDIDPAGAEKTPLETHETSRLSTTPSLNNLANAKLTTVPQFEMSPSSGLPGSTTQHRNEAESYLRDTNQELKPSVQEHDLLDTAGPSSEPDSTALTIQRTPKNEPSEVPDSHSHEAQMVPGIRVLRPPTANIETVEEQRKEQSKQHAEKEDATELVNQQQDVNGIQPRSLPHSGRAPLPVASSSAIAHTAGTDHTNAETIDSQVIELSEDDARAVRPFAVKLTFNRPALSETKSSEVDDGGSVEDATRQTAQSHLDREVTYISLQYLDTCSQLPPNAPKSHAHIISLPSWTPEKHVYLRKGDAWLPDIIASVLHRYSRHTLDQLLDLKSCKEFWFFCRGPENSRLSSWSVARRNDIVEVAMHNRMPTPIRRDNEWDSANISDHFKAVLRFVYSGPASSWHLVPDWPTWTLQLEGTRFLNATPETDREKRKLRQKRAYFLINHIVKVALSGSLDEEVCKTTAGYQLRYRPSEDRVRAFANGNIRQPVDD